MCLFPRAVMISLRPQLNAKGHREMHTSVVFVHGWAMCSDMWSGVSTAFSNHEKIDLGFVGRDFNKGTVTKDKAVFITHSAGTLYALRHHADQMSALISINGFASFKTFADERTLRKMKAQLLRDPVSQRQDFWNNCGLTGQPKGAANIARLQEGLDWLQDWDETQMLSDLKIPVLSLAGAQDMIAPIDVMKDAWKNFELKIMEDGAHVLPVTHPKWCVEKIRDFVGDHGLEK